jgi:hypothetical protein
MFDALNTYDEDTDRDVFEDYLSSPPAYTPDPLMYWHQEIKQKRDGGLGQFALDFLSVPGMLYPFDVSFIFAYYVDSNLC